MSEDHLTSLIGQIYDAAFDPDLWVRVMEMLARELSAEAACMTTLDIFTGEGGGHTALVPDDTMAIYTSRWAQNNPLHDVGDPLLYVAAWQPATIRYEDWVQRETLHRTAYFNEFLRSIASENGIMMGLTLIGTTTTTMNFARPLHRDIFNDHEIAHARRWQTHLGRSVRLGRQVQISQAALDAVDQLVATTPHRLFFTDVHGRIQRMSPLAEAMLGAGAALRSVNGVLTATLPDEDAALRRLIAQAGSRDPATAAGGAMRLRGTGGASYGLDVAPLGPRSSATWSTEPIILITVASGPAPALPTELRLRRRFGLTPAETRVALAIAQGGTLREVADGAAISIHTVRAQLSTIFAKTGCRRQADLIRTLLAFDQDKI